MIKLEFFLLSNQGVDYDRDAEAQKDLSTYLLYTTSYKEQVEGSNISRC